MYVYSLLIKSCVLRPLCANQNTETLCFEAPHESMCALIERRWSNYSRFSLIISLWNVCWVMFLFI